MRMCAHIHQQEIRKEQQPQKGEGGGERKRDPCWICGQLVSVCDLFTTSANARRRRKVTAVFPPFDVIIIWERERRVSYFFLGSCRRSLGRRQQRTTTRKERSRTVHTHTMNMYATVIRERTTEGGRNRCKHDRTKKK